MTVDTAVGANQQRVRGLRVVATSFSRGIVDSIAPDQIPDDAVVDALNVEYDRQHNLRTRQGCARLNWNGNLLGDIFDDVGAVGWTLSNVTANAGWDAPTDDPAKALRDTSAAAVGMATATISGAGTGQLWGASCYIHVPRDPLDPPAFWDGTIPGIALEFTGGVARGGGACLVPDISLEIPWAIKPLAAYPSLKDYRIGLTEPDPDDDDWVWVQIIIHVVNNDAANTAANLRLFPAISAYTIGGTTFTYGTDSLGRVTSAVTAVNAAPGVGFWGGVLERGRTPIRQPATGGNAATIAANYFTGRVTSVFYYPTAATSAVLATSGNKLYRYVPSEGWFASIGSLALPTDTLWQWTIFDGEAIGVNRDKTGVRAAQTFTAAINFLDGETITLNGQAYTFETGALDAPFKVDVGADLEESLLKLGRAVNGTGTVGVDYAAGTTAHATMRATSSTATTLTVAAITQGTAGNALTVAEGVADAGAVWGAGTLAGGAGNVNPVLLTSPSATPTGLDGSPPMGRYITQWNGRVWIVPEDEPWTIRCSKLGDAHNWTDTDPASGSGSLQVDWQSGFDITGIIVYQGVLLVFTRKKILAIVPGQPVNTDLSEYRVETLHVGIGSISGYAIRTLLQDVVFMSANGLVSLTMLERLGSFEENGLSRDIEAFGDAEVVAERAVIENYPRKAQLLCAFAPRLGSRNSNAYILDYRSLAQQGVDGASHPGFTRASGPLQAASMCLADVSSEERLLLGSEVDLGGGVAYVWLYDQDDTFLDEGARYPVSILTKAYSWGDLFMPKRFHRWEALFELLEPDVDLAITWRPDLRNSSFQVFPRILEGQAALGAVWGSAIWGSDLWAGSDITQNVFTSGRFAGTSIFGRTARALQAQIEPTGDPTGIVFKGFVLAASWGRDLAPRGSGGVSSSNNALITEEGEQLATGAGEGLVHE